MQERFGWSLFGVAVGLLLAKLSGFGIVLALAIVAVIAAGAAYLIFHAQWDAELHEFRRKHLPAFCAGLDRADPRWHLYDYRGSGMKLMDIGLEIGSKFYQPFTAGGTPSDRCLLGSDAYQPFEDARAGLVDICDKWGKRWRLGGFGAFLDTQWKDYGQQLVMLGYVEKAKAISLLLDDRLSETGLGRILARYQQASIVRSERPGPSSQAFPQPPTHGP